MKKIKASFDQKDRIICVTNPGCHEFYYQPVGSKERILLFMIDEYERQRIQFNYPGTL